MLGRKDSRGGGAGFTLIELIMVVAILAIISTFAIGRVGNLKEMAARKVSIANQQNAGRVVDGFLAIQEGALNRLDALVNAKTPLSGAAGYDFGDVGRVLYRGPADPGSLPPETVRERNGGLGEGLLGVLCVYRVNEKEAAALRKLGLAYVMQHNTFAEGRPFDHYGRGDDGAVPQGDDGLDADLSACFAAAVTNGMAFAAIDGTKDAGRAVFQDCGQGLLHTSAGGAGYNEVEVKAEIQATGGPLLALGLGSSASIVGAAQGGFDAAPYSEVLPDRHYRQFILLFRLRTHGTGSASVVDAEFAGVLDPEGNTIRAARHLLKK